MTASPRFPQVFQELIEGRLSAGTVRRVFDAILGGEWTPVQIAGFATAVRVQGETADIVTAAAQAMRAAMVRVPHSLPRVLDTCGTGGDGLDTVNLSTGAAIIVASHGVPVAKHGNRAASSRAGSADVLEALGIPIDLPATAVGPLLERVGITFLMAQVHHPAMRHAGPARRELGIRTLFNCLGPLSNPAGATHQLVGAADDSLLLLLAEALRSLGSVRGWVVRGVDGMDEVSPTGRTRVAAFSATGVSELEVAPEDFGLAPIPAEALRGGDARENAGILEKVLGGEPHPSVSGFVINAAAALVVADDLSPRAAADAAREALATGAAKALLDRWREAARELGPLPTQG